MERLLAHAFETGLIMDASIAQNDAQRAAFWKVREEQSAAQKPEGGGWKHDVSVPVSRIADFLDEADGGGRSASIPAPGSAPSATSATAICTTTCCVPPGGDLPPSSPAGTRARSIVHDIVARYDGSISAEHGLGRLKTDEARRYKSPLSRFEAMRAIRGARPASGS